MEEAPNARSMDDDGDVVSFGTAGGALKIEYHVERSSDERKPGWLEFKPANLKVWLNGTRVELCDHVSIEIPRVGMPTAVIKFTLTDLDIDADSMLALQAIVDNKSKEE